MRRVPSGRSLKADDGKSRQRHTPVRTPNVSGTKARGVEEHGFCRMTQKDGQPVASFEGGQKPQRCVRFGQPLVADFRPPSPVESYNLRTPVGPTPADETKFRASRVAWTVTP